MELRIHNTGEGPYHLFFFHRHFPSADGGVKYTPQYRVPHITDVDIRKNPPFQESLVFVESRACDR